MKNDINREDENLQVKEKLDVPDCSFHDVKESPFKIYGLCKASEGFRRVPAETAEQAGVKIELHALHTAGGRVRFATNSEYIAIKCVLPSVTRYSHMPLIGTSGFDMYVFENGEEHHAKSCVPPHNMTDGYSSIHHFGTREMREITINFPTYNPVSELYIGLEERAGIHCGREYKYNTPVVYYGSSITQGACASRPGNNYAALISRKLDCDYINLGFSGTPMGGNVIVDYIASLDMSVFVYDFDYNAPSLEYLKDTHKKVYKKIRAAHPALPIIILSAANNAVCDKLEEKRKIAFETYSDAKLLGDENVYFIDGKKLYDGEFSDSCMVDGIHPSDAGFFRMAEIVGKQIMQVV